MLTFTNQDETTKHAQTSYLCFKQQNTYFYLCSGMFRAPYFSMYEHPAVTPGCDYSVYRYILKSNSCNSEL